MITVNHDDENGVLTICLEGRIDTGNALTLEKELMDVTTEHPEAVLELDGEKLEYIMDKHLRGVVIPNAQTIRNLYRTL